jgi:hypothetical protein
VCLITASKKGILLDDTRFLASESHNPDGIGIMFPEGGRLRIIKNMENRDKRLAIYKSIPTDRPHVLHQRYATHGNKDLKMCHPFRVTDKEKHGLDLFVMHNGVMGASTVDIHSQGKSDTWHFVKDYLRPILSQNPRLVRNSGFKRMVSKLIGSGNKLVFLDNEGVTTIINRESGTVIDEFWFSNTYSLSGTYRNSNPTNTYRGAAAWADDDEWNSYCGYYGQRTPGGGYASYERDVAAAHRAAMAANISGAPTSCVTEAKKTVITVENGTATTPSMQLQLPPPATVEVEAEVVTDEEIKEFQEEERAKEAAEEQPPFDPAPKSAHGSSGSAASALRSLTSFAARGQAERAWEAASLFKDMDFEDRETLDDFEMMLAVMARDPETLAMFLEQHNELMTCYLVERLGYA